MCADNLGLLSDEFIERVLTLVEEAADAERRRAALERRMKADKATDSQVRAAMASNAPPAVRAAKLAAARGRKNLAAAEFNAAIAEGEDAWTDIIAEAAERVGMIVVIPPRPGEVDHYDANGRLVGRSKRVGNKISHYSSDGKLRGTTNLSGRKLFTRSMTGTITGKHVIKS